MSVLDFTPAAHPRSRGEHVALWAIAALTIGSSPLARGTFIVVMPFVVLGRLIPARAGNMAVFVFEQGGKPAHPRSRGEH